jgi:hypothetical protein
MSARIRKTLRSKFPRRKMSDMESPQRGALMLVRFVAACAMSMSVIELALGFAEFKFRGTPVNVFIAALWGILFLIGVVILVKAKSIAEWISDKMDL